MKRTIIFVSLIFFIVSNLYAITPDEILKIIDDRSLKYEEAIEVLNIVRGIEIFSLYSELTVVQTSTTKCPFCKLNIEKIVLWPFETPQYDDDNNFEVFKGISLIQCSNCRLCSILYYHVDNNTNIDNNFVIFSGRISKKDFEDIQENIKNKITYEDALNIVKALRSCSTTRTTNKKCQQCNKESLMFYLDGFGNYKKFKLTTLLVCQNKKCKSFALFKKNTETDLFDCLYHGKYNKLEDVLLY